MPNTVNQREIGMVDLNPVDFNRLAARLDEWRRHGTELTLLALVPEAEAGKVPMLQALCRERNVPLSGAIFPALVTSGGFRSKGMILLRSARALPSALVGELPSDSLDAAARIVAAVDGPLAEIEGETPPTLYLIFDSLVPHIASILDSLYLTLADRVIYAGVNAGSETFQPMACLFDGERIVGGGVLCLLLPPGTVTVMEHGFQAPERVMSATGTEGNRILQIDWQPAFATYQEIIRAEYGIALTPENFYEYAVHFPFGILRANNEVVVRIPVALEADGSLFCVGEVPENSILTLLKAPAQVDDHFLLQLIRGLEDAGGSTTEQPLLCFYCAGRRMHFGEAATLELQRLKHMSRAHVLVGALTLGEIGSTQTGGYPLFHNATVVCMPWGYA